MSIFKDTLSPFVQKQLEARKQVVSQWGDTGAKDKKGNAIYNAGVVPRDEKFLRFVAGKNAWVKMQSFVNFDGQIGSAKYTDSQLARKYVLEGGTLFEAKNDKGQLTNKFTLRSGVGRRDSVYASDIDLGGDRPLGYRPMPGITNIQINNKSAYGSLREATVKFYAWDKHQLEELELLYMRTGYSVLLEWGWSQYLDSNDLDNIKIENFTQYTIDTFNDKEILSPGKDVTPDEVIYGKIRTINEKTSGNYDAMLGYVKNFSWQLMDNGGFECTTVLISRGEVISTLKLSSNGPSFTNSVTNQDSPPLSLFESLMLNYSALINEKELTDISNPGQPGQFTSGSSITSNTVSDLKTDLNTRLDTTTLIDYNGNNSSSDIKNSFSSEYGKILLTDGNVNGVGIEYIKMDVFIALLNLYFNYKDENNRTISQIVIPKNTPCLASVDSVSIDSSTCIIYNKYATFITGNDTEGALPKTLTTNPSAGVASYDDTNSINDEQFLMSGKLGKIGNIFISIPKILDIYRSKGSSTGVSVIDFLKELLGQISKALGGINDFQLHTTKSTVQIIDVKYLEQGAGGKKYTMDLLGLKSICRDVKIVSRIFESQSSMIAIAAQNRNNVGDLYSSTQAHFNKGLTDRIVLDKVIWNEKGLSDKDKLRKTFGNLISLQSYIARKCIGTPKGDGSNLSTILYPTSEEINNAASLFKTFLLQLNEDDIDFKAIIPFELEIVLDGISGMVQGQIFKVDTSLLPERYHKSNIGFIITGLSHSLQRNDWTTTIKAQICLLDNEKLGVSGTESKKALSNFKADIQTLVETRKINVVVWAMLADYMTFVADKFYKIIENKEYNFRGGGWFGSDKQIPVKETTARLAVEAYSYAGAVVYEGGDDNPKGAYFFSYPYKKTKRTATSSGGDVPDINNVANRTTFAYIVGPDIAAYFKAWIGEAKKKHAGDAEFVEYLNKLNVDVNDPFGSVRTVAKAEANGELNLPDFTFSSEAMNRFLSYGVRFNGEDDRLKDSFILRSPDYVQHAKTNCQKWDEDAGVAFYPFESANLDLFIKTTVDGKDQYTYKERPNNGALFNIFYKYIIDSKFFNDLDVLMQPSAANQATAKSIYNPTALSVY